MKIRWMTTAVLAAAVTAGMGAVAQTGAQNPAATQAGGQNWTTDQLLTASVHDAWVMSGKNEKTFFDMVSQLAQISAQKRGLTLPDNEAAGKRFGELIKTMAKADHDQLLYVVVDKAVQQVGTKS